MRAEGGQLPCVSFSIISLNIRSLLFARPFIPAVGSPFRRMPKPRCRTTPAEAGCAHAPPRPPPEEFDPIHSPPEGEQSGGDGSADGTGASQERREALRRAMRRSKIPPPPIAHWAPRRTKNRRRCAATDGQRAVGRHRPLKRRNARRQRFQRRGRVRRGWRRRRGWG